MSAKVYTKCQLLWYKACFSTIAQKYESLLASDPYTEIVDEDIIDLLLTIDLPDESDKKEESSFLSFGKKPVQKEPEKPKLTKSQKAEKLDKLEKIRRRNKKRDRAKWRFGVNLYKCGDYFKAAPLLDFISKGGAKGESERKIKIEALTRAGKSIDGVMHETMDKRSEVHLAAARCCKFLFFDTKAHYHLEAGYGHYSNCVETMGADLSAMFRLPALLYEFGSLLENYGAMKPALELYSKILSNFPNFKGYFDAMYRAAVVGKHLAGIFCINFIRMKLPY